MTAKQQILEFIERMPDDVSVEEAIEGLYLLNKIQIGLRQVEAGDVISHEEVKRQFLTMRSVPE